MLRKTLLAGAAVAALAVPAMAGTFGNDYYVEVTNNTPYVLEELYASNRDTGNWLNDLLGSEVLYPGQSISVDTDDGSGYCIFDLQAVFEDGAEANWFGANVCEINLWNVRR